jgi:hypothetical protein
MFIIIAYAIGLVCIFWYTLFYLPFAEYTHTFSFSLNIIQWGIVSLLSFLAFRQEKHYRSIFFQFWIFYAMLSLIAPALFHFTYWYQGNGGIYAYVYVLIICHFLQSWIVVNILLTYVFRDEKRMTVNAITALVVLPLCLWLLWPLWLRPETVITFAENGDYTVSYRSLELSLIWVNSFSILVLLAFFLHKLRTDKPIGAYADTLLFLFGMMIVFETVEYISSVTEIQLLSMSQWVYGLIAAAMIVTLLLRLKFKSQTIADYYESQCISDNPDIDRRVGSFDRIIIRCFFNPEKVSKEVFLGVGRKKMKVRRTPARISRSLNAR